MEYLPISFIAGILTILAPCVLPLLPIIIGGSLTEKSIKRPLIITASLAGSIVFFTLILKASTIFIDIPDTFWKYFSAGIILIFAITLLFPNLWTKISAVILPSAGHTKLNKIIYALSQKNSIFSLVLLGVALGPIFASCSPTYFLILSTVLPASFFVGVLNLFAYALGLSIVMFLVAFSGQKIMTKLNIASDPNGWFKKVLGVLFLIVAIAIATGYDKKFETYLLDSGLFSITKVEQKLLDNVVDKNNPMNDKKEEEKDKKMYAKGTLHSHPRLAPFGSPNTVYVVYSLHFTLPYPEDSGHRIY